MTIHTAIGVATIGTLAGLWWYAEKGPNPMTMILRAGRWLAAGWQWRHTARTAWRNGADLLTALAVFRQRSPSEPCPVCTAKHCAGCEEPARVTAAPTAYVARHCQEEIPPSILVPALMMTAVERAKALTRELGNAAWRPTRPYRTAVSWT